MTHVYRRSIGLSERGKQTLDRLVKRRNSSGNQVIESALDWMDRVDEVVKDGRISAVTITYPDGRQETIRVL